MRYDILSIEFLCCGGNEMSSTSFQELNLNHGFLFPAALEDPQTCRLVVECITGETVGELEIKAEYTRLYDSELKCIRLDIYAKDIVTEVSYNLEMQNRNEYNLPLRSRYYQAQIDVGGLKPGEEYDDLKPLYVIFICNFDPFGKELYRYTFSMQCEERNFPLNDGVKRIFFNTKGKNKEAVSKILIDFLGYLNDSTDAYINQELDEKIKEIHGRIKLLKQNRDVEKRYMHYLNVEKLIKAKEKLAEDAERKAEDAERKAEDAERKLVEAEKILKDILWNSITVFGEISANVREFIEKEDDINIIRAMHNIAMKAESKEQFENQINLLM